MTSVLTCTVRGCGLPLDRRDRTWVCARNHSYDIARSGYINLLQPYDRRSLKAGDSEPVVAARARLIAAGAGRALIDDLVRRCGALQLTPDAVVADLGSGTGDALAALVHDRPLAGIGIDLSTAAARHAARRFPHLTWVVANADRRLPLPNDRISLLLSLHGRRNPGECARALTPGGSLFAAVPAADDLVELRTLLHGTGIAQSRVESLMTDHDPFFTPVERFSIRERHTFDRSLLNDLLQTTYRGARTSASVRVASLTTMDVTLASDCVRFVRRGVAT